MDGLAPVSVLLLGGLPAGLDHLRVGQLVKDAVAAKHDVVVVVFDLEAFNVWCGHDNFRIALIFSSLCLNVAEGSRDREAPREDAMGPEKNLISHNPRLGVLVLDFGDRLGPIQIYNISILTRERLTDRSCRRPR